MCEKSRKEKRRERREQREPRKVADKRIYPALDITRSGTRREELLFAKDELSKMNVLRRIISPMGTMDGIEFLISKLKNTKNNSDFFDSMNKSSN